jgi:hypothetical protein
MDRTPVPYKTIEKSPVSRGYISRLLGYGTIKIQNRAGSSSPEVKIRHIQRWKETEQTIRKRYSIEKDRE